jgi:hypothetical protein
MSESLATVTAYWRREDAGVAQNALESAGIGAVVEQTVVAKVRVERLDAMRAGDVLNRTCDDLGEVGEADEEPNAAGCSACGSLDVKASMRGRMFASIVAVVIAVSVAVEQSAAAFCLLFAAGVYQLIAQRWRCGDCGNAWD